MKKIYLAAILLIGIVTGAAAQDKQQLDLIQSFYHCVYDSTVSPRQLARDYIDYSDSTGMHHAIGTIDMYRNRILTDSEGLFEKDILNKDYTITYYDSFDEDEKSSFRYMTDGERKQVYCLSPKHGRKHYVWMNNNSIKSFFGYKKAGSDSYTFIVYQ